MDESAVGSSRLFCVYPHVYMSAFFPNSSGQLRPPDYRTTATCIIALQSPARKRFFVVRLDKFGYRVNSPGGNQCLAAGNAGSGEGGSGEPDNWCRLTAIWTGCQIILKVPHNFESDRLRKLSNEIDNLIDSNR